jgi:hypothetical protein
MLTNNNKSKSTFHTLGDLNARKVIFFQTLFEEQKLIASPVT